MFLLLLLYVALCLCQCVKTLFCFAFSHQISSVHCNGNRENCLSEDIITGFMKSLFFFFLMNAPLWLLEVLHTHSYLFLLPCAALCPEWSRRTSGYPWRAARTGGPRGRGEICGSCRAGAPCFRWTTRPCGEGSGPPAPRRTAQSPLTPESSDQPADLVGPCFERKTNRLITDSKTVRSKRYICLTC